MNKLILPFNKLSAIMYYDHYETAIKPSMREEERVALVNWACGLVVQEDDDYVRLAYNMDKITDPDEAWEITAINKASIVHRQDFEVSGFD